MASRCLELWLKGDCAVHAFQKLSFTKEEVLKENASFVNTAAHNPPIHAFV